MSHPKTCAAMNGRVDKAELIAKLQSLQGLTEGERGELIRLLRTHKKYGLVWEDKPEDVEERLRDELPVFREVKERAILAPSLGGGQGEAPNHILIEGDNLEALTALSYTHEGKIDVIYIDPPYNTGNKDFVYNDSFVDSEDSYRHSKWLSFMNKRLKIAKRLLSDKGVIFISIDDNEQAQLKLLCDEVFGKDNLCGEFIWRKKSGGGQTDIFFVTEHEYVLVYQKSASFHWLDPMEVMSEEDFSFEDEKGKYNTVKLEKWGSSAHKEDRPSMYFPIKDLLGNDYYPVAPDGAPGRWRVGIERMFLLINNNEIEWKNGIPYEKVYFNPQKARIKVFKSRSILYQIGETGDGSKMLTEILGVKDKFDNPKPVSLVKELIYHNTSSTILDFFAGSGTTLHATMQLNAEDGGHRQCILVTNNENGICENVTYERNKRVINGYTTPKGVEVEGLHNNNLRYYRTDFISRDRTQRNMRELVSAATDMLCIKEDLYTEQERFGRYKVNPQLMRYFSDGRKHMLVVYREEIVDELAKEIASMDFGMAATSSSGGAGGRLKIYIFSPGRYAFDDNFFEVQDKVQLIALPAAIYDAYQKVLPRRREKILPLAKEEESKNPTEGVGGEENHLE